MLHKTSYSHTFCLFIALATVLLLPGCKKDKDTSSPGMQGSWVVMKSLHSSPEYYVFTADNKLYKLANSFDDYPEVEYWVYSFKNDQLTLQGGEYYNPVTSLFNIRFSGDTAFLNDGTEDVTTLLKDNLAPQKLNDWTNTLTATDKFIDTVETKTITYRNGKIYTFKYYNTGGSKFITYKPETHSVSSLTPADDTYSGLDYAPDGTLWCANAQYAYIFDPVAGIQTFQSTANTPGNYLWACAVGNGMLYNYASGAFINYEINSATWSGESDVDNTVTDLAYADGYLYVAKNGMLYKKHTYYSGALDSWFLEGYHINGVAYAGGTDFWLAARNNSTGSFEMLKVTL